MMKLDEMSLSQIIAKTGLCLSTEAFYDIWKKDATPEISIFNPSGISAFDELKKKGFVEEIVSDRGAEMLTRFLIAHECEMDKVKLVINIIKSYEGSLENSNLSPKQRENYKKGLAAARKLLVDIDQTYLQYIQNDKTGRIDSFTVIKTKDLAKGASTYKKSKNEQRLKELETEWDFLDIISQIPTSALEQILICPIDINREISAIIEYNVALDELHGNVKELMSMCEMQEFESYINLLEPATFAPEMDRILREHIEAVDMDKLLLCAGVMYMKELETADTSEDIAKMYQRLQVIKNNIKKNSELQFMTESGETKTYDSKAFIKELRRFVVTENKIEYFTAEKCAEMRSGIVAGSLSLNSLKPEEFEALSFSVQEINSLLRTFPSNYIFFLRQGKLIDSKDIILKNIIKSKECPQELLKLLCEQTNITHDEIHQLFDMGIISASDMESIKDIKEHLISDAKLFEKYTEYKDAKDEDKEKARTQLERYALAYRKIELLGKTDEELMQRGEEFVQSVFDDIKTEDFVHLYGLDIISFKVAVSWEENIIEPLLQTERLKPADARYLRDKGLLNKEVLARAFENNANMSYAYQLALVCTVFDGQTKEEQEIKQELAQYYHIENGMANSGSRSTGKKRGLSVGQINGPQQKVKMRDPGAKYNLLAAIDKGVKIEEGIIDGHIIFHYPNVDGGTVLIEKLHKITTDRATGLKEIKADTKAATYIISEEEFIEIKSTLIQDGKINRAQLTQKWCKEPGYWLAHIGNDSWERGIKNRFNINSTNPRYSDPKDLARMEKLLLESAQSKDIEDR